jgi:hypothetical protein
MIKRMTPEEIATPAVSGLRTRLDVHKGTPAVHHQDEGAINSANPAGGYVSSEKFRTRK